MPAVEIECLQIKVLLRVDHVDIVVDLWNMLAEFLTSNSKIRAYLYIEVSIMS